MSSPDRFHALDAVRGFALLLGVVFHAGFSFLPGMTPGVWAIVDRSPSTSLSVVLFASHIFRMSLFFFVAGFLARLMFHRRGARAFWVNRAKRILVPLVAGWPLVFPPLAVVWIWGLARTFGGTVPAPPADVPSSPPGAFPLTHLWFLYYLMILYGIALTARAGVVRLDRTGWVRRAVDSFVAAIVRMGIAPLVLAVPVAAALYFRSGWVAWFGIPTPDRSVIPEVTSLVAYGAALTFGWLVHRQTDLLEAWARQWALNLAGALTATIACLSLAGATPTLTPAAPGPRTVLYAVSYGVGIWCWTFAIIGLATRFMAHANRSVRYVSDASYWIYIAHLPIVVLFQVLVGHVPWHWSIKFPLILAASLSILFVSYRYLVRPTFIGQTLNGRRYPRSRPGDDASGGDAGGHSGGTDAGITPRSASAASPETPLRDDAAIAGIRDSSAAAAGVPR